MKWSHPIMSGIIPSPRFEASMVSVGTNIFLFGKIIKLKIRIFLF